MLSVDQTETLLLLLTSFENHKVPAVIRNSFGSQLSRTISISDVTPAFIIPADFYIQGNCVSKRSRTSAMGITGVTALLHLLLR